MKNSIFWKLNDLYRLKVPNKKYINTKHYEMIQKLTNAFYQQYFRKNLNIQITHDLLKIKQQLPSTKQCYKQLFYLLPSKKSMILDFIACIVCLLSDIIFIQQSVYKIPQIQKLGQKIHQQGILLRQHLMLHYNKQTINQQISKQCASSIFNQVIQYQNLKASTFNSRMILNYKMKKITQNLKSDKNMIKKRHRRKKQGSDSYADTVRQILQKNLSQIQDNNQKLYQQENYQCCQKQAHTQQNNRKFSRKNKFRSLHLSNQRKYQRTLRLWNQHISQLKSQSYTGNIQPDKSYQFLPLIKKNRQSTLPKSIINNNQLKTNSSQLGKSIKKSITFIINKKFQTNQLNTKFYYNSQRVNIGEKYNQRDSKMSLLQNKENWNNNQSVLFPNRIKKKIEPKQRVNIMRNQLQKIIANSQNLYNYALNSQLPIFHYKPI